MKTNNALKLLSAVFIVFVLLNSSGCAIDNRTHDCYCNSDDILTTDATNITHSTAKLNGTLFDSAAIVNVYEFGFILSTHENFLENVNPNGINFNISQSYIMASVYFSNSTDFALNLSGSFISPSTTYYYTTYVKKNNTYHFGGVAKFTTPETPNGRPVVTTCAVSAIAQTTATACGEILSDSGNVITQRGVCYSLSTNPTTSDSTVTNPGTTIGSFNVNLTGLSPNTTYYVKAYATNSQGTSYGTEESFTTNTPNNNTVPTVTTATVSAIMETTATAGGNLVNDGGNTITEKGVCYSLSSNPTINDSKEIVSGTNTGNYSANLSGLSPGTTYYVKAYATNSQGTSYGTEESFTTNTPNNNANYLGTYTVVSNDTFTVNSNDVVITAVGTSGITIGNFGNYPTPTNVTATISQAGLLTIDPSPQVQGDYTISNGTGSISADLTTITINYTVEAYGYTSNRTQTYTRK